MLTLLAGFLPYRLRKNFLKALILVLTASSSFTFLACENYRPGDPIITQSVTVTNVDRDTIIGIPNEKLASTATISFIETLSDTALVRISPDTAFLTNGVLFLLPIKNPPIMSIGGLSGDSLFIQYKPYKKPLSGDLTIEIMLHN